MQKREGWIDACRFFAIFVIMTTHFLAMFLPEALLLWERMPTRLLLGGLTGKFSVAFFFVLLGYFASTPGDFDGKKLLLYTLRRYRQLCFFVLAVTFCYVLGGYACAWLFHTPDENVFRLLSDGPRYNLIYTLRDAYLFEDNYNATLWCMRQLFLASVLCRLLGYLPEKIDPRLRLAVAFAALALSALMGKTWVWLGVAALGYALRLILSGERVQPVGAVLVMVFLLAVACIKAPLEEGTALYTLQGIGALLLLYVLFHTAWAQRLLASKPFPRLGLRSMGLFVVHTPVNCLLASTLWPILSARLPKAAALTVCYCLSVALSILAAFLLHRAYGALVKRNR